MEFEKRLRLRMVFLMLIIAGGVVSIAVGLLLTGKIGDFSSGYFCGMGFGLTAAGAVLAVRTAGTLKNREKLRAKRIMEEDERNTLLNLTSSHLTYLIVMTALFLGTIYYAFNDEKILHVLAGVVILIFAVKIISYFIIMRRMQYMTHATHGECDKTYVYYLRGDCL
jgi:hypothetical protein